MIDRRKRKWLLLSGAAALLVLAFLLFGPPKLIARSDSPVFCSGCHVMEAEYDAWSHNGAHRRRLCVDCHLPNQNRTAHYIGKAIDGLKDVAFFYSGRVPERIQLTEEGRRVLQANCVRCHEQTVMMISTERPCWSCHRRIAHRLTGAMQTL